MVGMEMRIIAPKHYQPDPQLIAETDADVTVTDDLDGVIGVDVLYTDVWISMGQEAEQARREQAFAGYQLDRSLLDIAAPDAIYLHCLPAHRGEEISAELMDAPDTVIWDEAENRLHAQKALVEFLLTAS